MCASVWLIDNKCKLSTDTKYIKCLRTSINTSLRLAEVYGKYTNNFTHSCQTLLDDSIIAATIVVSPKDLMNPLNVIGSNSFINLSTIIFLILWYSKFISLYLMRSYIWWYQIATYLLYFQNIRIFDEFNCYCLLLALYYYLWYSVNAFFLSCFCFLGSQSKNFYFFDIKSKKFDKFSCQYKWSFLFLASSFSIASFNSLYLILLQIFQLKLFKSLTNL